MHESPDNITKRVLLHLKFKKTFRVESQDNIVKVWSKAPAVFMKDNPPSKWGIVENITDSIFTENKRQMIACYEHERRPKLLVTSCEELLAWQIKLPSMYWLHRLNNVPLFVHAGAFVRVSVHQ
jgi:hypothetical protein